MTKKVVWEEILARIVGFIVLSFMVLLAARVYIYMRLGAGSDKIMQMVEWIRINGTFFHQLGFLMLLGICAILYLAYLLLCIIPFWLLFFGANNDPVTRSFEFGD